LHFRFQAWVVPAVTKLLLLLLWPPLHLQEDLQEALQVQVEVHHWAEEEEGPL
jgi:hypothetical protein